MNRKNLIIAVAAMAAMIAVGIVGPTVYRATKDKPKAAQEATQETTAESPSEEEEAEPQKPDDSPLTFLEFQDLSAFFSESEIEDLKGQIPEYLERAAISGITSAKFLKDQTSYPSSTDTLLVFSLSDGSTLPVLYRTPSGSFLFGEEQLQIRRDTKTYERKTDESLPEVSADEVEEMQEGGYADTEETPAPEPKEVSE